MFIQKYVGPLSLLSIGLLYGISGVMAKYLSQWLNPYQVVGLRFFIAFLFALMIMLITRNTFQLHRLDKKTLLLFAVSYPVSVIFFTLSVFYTKVSLAVFSFYIANLVSSFVVGSLFFHERIDSRKQIALAFVVVALICFTNPLKSFVLDIGFVFGIVSGILQTIASAYQKLVGKATDRLGLVIIQTCTGFLIALLAMGMTGTFSFPGIPTIAVVVSVIFGAMFLAVSFLYLVGFQKTNLNVGSILVSSELFFGPLFAFIVLSEMPSGLELVGGLFTIIAVVFANL